MQWADWYTDLADVYRVQDVKSGNLIRHERAQVSAGIPCRIYQTSRTGISMSQMAASERETSALACDVSADIRSGDELIITRGGRLGKPLPMIRAFAGEPRVYYEPFGAIMPGLAHQEIQLLQQERVDSLDGSGEGETP